MLWGIWAALGSSSLRAILNVLDRKVFGHKRAGVVFINLVNNFLSLILILPPVVLSNPRSIMLALSDVHNLWLAGLIQLVAYAFSLAFRYLTIPQVIVFSKLPDLFIPIGIYIVSRVWSPVDFAFSTLTTLVCLPLLFQGPKESRIYARSWWVLGFLMSAVVLRGVFSGALVQGKGNGPSDWLLVTMVTLWWRFIWSLAVMIGAFGIRKGVIWTSPGVLLLLGRAGITLAVQALYILALVEGPITAIWPIINSTALFATVFSSAFFREHPTGRELMAILGITGLTVARMFYR